jgi:hypothetical protein
MPTNRAGRGDYRTRDDYQRLRTSGSPFLVRFCKPDANIPAGATGTVSIWTAGPADSGAVDTTRNESGYAPHALTSGQWATITTIQGNKYVLPFVCTT